MCLGLLMSGKEKGSGAESDEEDSVSRADGVELIDFARGTLSDSNSDGFLDRIAWPLRTPAWDLGKEKGQGAYWVSWVTLKGFLDFENGCCLISAPNIML